MSNFYSYCKNCNGEIYNANLHFLSKKEGDEHSIFISFVLSLVVGKYKTVDPFDIISTFTGTQIFFRDRTVLREIKTFLNYLRIRDQFGIQTG